MRKILVAVDSSEPALHAATMAADIAAQSGSAVLLAHSTQPLLMASGWIAAQAPELEVAERNESETMLDHMRSVLKLKYPKVVIETAAIRGQPADAMTALADSEDAELVVVGSRSHGKLGRTLLGSFASKLVHTCKRPVLVVR